VEPIEPMIMDELKMVTPFRPKKKDLKRTQPKEAKSVEKLDIQIDI
jgi:hypothetical protein